MWIRMKMKIIMALLASMPRHHRRTRCLRRVRATRTMRKMTKTTAKMMKVQSSQPRRSGRRSRGKRSQRPCQSQRQPGPAESAGTADAEEGRTAMQRRTKTDKRKRASRPRGDGEMVTGLVATADEQGVEVNPRSRGRRRRSQRKLIGGAGTVRAARKRRPLQSLSRKSRQRESRRHPGSKRKRPGNQERRTGPARPRSPSTSRAAGTPARGTLVNSGRRTEGRRTPNRANHDRPQAVQRMLAEIVVTDAGLATGTEAKAKAPVPRPGLPAGWLLRLEFYDRPPGWA
mmetsp:Transcript_5086/g.12027  ORF Transcript_5086/g.12027 Transcript_5086/m.12027 type:complete len:287 (+) Transcript_5086:240-1100(+)